VPLKKVLEMLKFREGYDLNFDVMPYHHKDPLFRAEIQQNAIDLTQTH
jgi:hypothetical protein